LGIAGEEAMLEQISTIVNMLFLFFFSSSFFPHSLAVGEEEPMLELDQYHLRN
jgi:hypothetical protein